MTGKIRDTVHDGNNPANKTLHPTAGNAPVWIRASLPAVDELYVVRRAKQGASYQVKDLLFQNLASRNYRVLQSC